MLRYSAEFFDHGGRVFSRCDYRVAREACPVAHALARFASGIGKGFHVLQDGVPVATHVMGEPLRLHVKEKEDALV